MLRIYLLVFLGLFLLSFIGLSLIFMYLSPNTFPLLAPILLYFLLFISSFSFFALAGYFVRRVVSPKINKFIIFNMSIRQGLLLAIFIDVSAYLLHLRVFTWWSSLLLLAILFILEAFFLVKESK